MALFYLNIIHPAEKATTSMKENTYSLQGGFMANTVCSRTASVTFWDGYAPWYKLWMEHNHYHNRIIEICIKDKAYVSMYWWQKK